MGCHFLLQGIFPAQGLNLGLPHGRRILYQLSHQGGRRDKPNTDSELGGAGCLARENPEETPRASDLNYHEGMSLSESAHASVHTYCILFLLTNTVLVSLISVFVGFFSARLKGPGLVTDHWSSGQDSGLSPPGPDPGV